MIARIVTLLASAGAFACASSSSSSSAPPPETVTRVGISSGAGSMGISELHNETSVAARRLNAPPDSVWSALPRAYELLAIPGAGVAPGGERLFGARDFRARRIDGERLSTWIDCGMGPTATPKADEYQVTMTLLTRVAAAEDGSTVLETTVQANGRPRATAGSPVSCPSNGKLEARLAELVVEVLAAGG